MNLAETIRKVRRLAEESPNPGERAQAQRVLAKLLKKQAGGRPAVGGPHFRVVVTFSVPVRTGTSSTSGWFRMV